MHSLNLHRLTANSRVNIRQAVVAGLIRDSVLVFAVADVVVAAHAAVMKMRDCVESMGGRQYEHLRHRLTCSAIAIPFDMRGKLLIVHKCRDGQDVLMVDSILDLYEFCH